MSFRSSKPLVCLLNLGYQKMDLTVSLKENPPTNGENNAAKDDGMIVRNSNRAKFMGTYYHQNFSLPDSIIFYIAKNHKTWKLYQKMVKTCKYFFVENPILVIEKPLSYFDSQWTIKKTPYNTNQTMSKLWIADNLYVSPKYSISAETKNQNIVTSIIPKVYRCDAFIIKLLKQVISYRDLPLLTSSAEWIFFHQVVVKHEDGSNVEVQKIVKIASNATLINISHPTITSKTMEELLKIPHFLTIREFTIKNVPKFFDIEAFYVYMKKNKTTKFILSFNESISDEYMKRLDEIVDEIIATKDFDYKPVLFDFRGLDDERHKKLHNIFYSQKRNF
uniref:Uncharacterized protein n=1 Tax=Panagrolaimus davidi TaxID=227884 RepID=A0A914PG25_9BILA